MKRKKTKKNGNITKAILALVFIIILVAVIIKMPGVFAVSYDDGSSQNKNEVMAEDKQEEIPVKAIVKHIKTPENTKTIYMTACVASTVDFKQDLVDLIEETELNSIIIDIKDFSGTIAFPTDNPALQIGTTGTGCKANSMKEFVEELHDLGIYVIGRITVFQDPLYTKVHPELAVQKASDRSTWTDHKGLAFVEVGAKPYWDYIVELSNESYELGFDELNYDYVRFPSDGNMNDIYYPFSEDVVNADPDFGKAKIVQEFFEYLNEKVRPDPSLEDRLFTSADLFGMTATNKDDLNIGQVLERTLPYFDFIAPMVYPSHYPANFNGWGNPNHYPYEIIEYSMSRAFERVEELLADTSTSTPAIFNKEFISTDQLRPWLQDFDYGGDYGPEEVRTQIQATYDSGLDSWMLWAPSNRYTRGALKSAE